MSEISDKIRESGLKMTVEITGKVPPLYPSLDASIVTLRIGDREVAIPYPMIGDAFPAGTSEIKDSDLEGILSDLFSDVELTERGVNAFSNDKGREHAYASFADSLRVKSHLIEFFGDDFEAWNALLQRTR